MAGRKKQNVDAYGKSWRPIDIPNLEKAVKLYERLNYLNDHFASSLSGANNIWNQINEKTDIQQELQKMGIKLTKEQCEEVIKIFNAQKDVNSELDKRNKSTSGVSGVINRANRSTTSTPKLNTSNFGSTITGAIQQNYAQTKLNENLKYYQNNAKNMGRDPNSLLVSKLAENKTVNDLKASSNKFSKASGILQVAADTFKAGVDTLFSAFKQGSDKQYNMLLNNSLGIGARNQTTVKQQTDALWNLNNQLGSWMPYSNSDDLRDNVGSSEVMEMWSKLAESGSSSEEMFANAIDNVVTQKIVPYLDTSSTGWQQLIKAQPELQKNIRGISRFNQEIAGNNYATQGMLDKILYDLQPMSEVAENDLAMSAAGATSMINSLMQQGYSEDAAKSIYLEGYKQRYRGSDILSNGTTAERMAYIANMNDPEANIYTTKGFIKGMGNIVDTQQYITNMALDTSSTTAGTVSSYAGKAFGMTMEQMLYTDKLNNKGLSGTSIANKINSNLDDLGNKSEQEMLKFLKGEYQTEEEKQRNWIENISNEATVIREKLGLWTGVAETLLNGIKTALLTWVGGKVLSSLLGLGGSSSGGLLKAITGGSSAGISIGTLAGVGVSAALIAAINAGVQMANKGSEEHGAYVGEESVKGTKYENNETVKALMSSTATISDRSGFQNGWNNMTSGIGYGVSNLIQGVADRNKNLTQWIMSSDTFGNAKDQASLAAHIAIWGLMMNQAGYFDSFKKGMKEAGANDWSNAKASDLGMLLADNKWTKENVNSWANSIIKAGWKPYYADKSRMESFELDSDKAGLKGVEGFRTGLSSVPYDNYPALLHEDEAVLTASTANELRNLLVEYRETKDQSANIEAAINSQTTSLLTKMDEIIRQIQSSGSTSGKVAAWSQRISNNMRNMTSTKAAFAN